MAKAFTAAPPADAESARPPIAKSLLAKLHHIFSTKEEPSLPVIKKDPSPQPFPQSSNPEATAERFFNPTGEGFSPLSRLHAGKPAVP